MALKDTLAKDFKNFGHAVAVAAKYTATGLVDILTYANKAQKIEPEVEVLVGALVGPIGANLTSLAFHAFGDIATALKPLSDDANQIAAQGLNVQLDVATIQAFKAAIPQLEAILSALGKSVPATVAPVKP